MLFARFGGQDGASDQFISSASNAVLYGIDDCRLGKGRSTPIAQCMWLQILSHHGHVDHASSKEIMVLDEVPCSSSPVQPLTRGRRNVNPVSRWRSRVLNRVAARTQDQVMRCYLTKVYWVLSSPMAVEVGLVEIERCSCSSQYLVLGCDPLILSL